VFVPPVARRESGPSRPPVEAKRPRETPVAPDPILQHKLPHWDFGKIAVFLSSAISGKSHGLSFATVLPAHSPSQAKLKMGAVGDSLEREADRVADAVASVPHSTVSPSRLREMQPHAAQATHLEFAPASVDRVLASPGKPLDPVLRSDMERRFGHEFSGVRIHTDPAAERSALEANANAYTVGEHLVFGTGRYAPHSAQGARLVAHELTHVVQQRTGAGKQSSSHGPAAINARAPLTLQREVIGSPVTTGVKFTVGKELTPRFAAAAKKAVADGTFDDKDLEKLRLAALADDQSVDDNERMFMAGLLDLANVSLLRRQRFEAGDKIEFAVGSITAARRARIGNLDRPAFPANVVTEAQAGAGALKQLDLGNALDHLSKMQSDSVAAIQRMTDPVKNVMAAILARAAIDSVSPTLILRAMINAASDSTPGDLAMSAAVYVIAAEISSPLAEDVLSGKIKVDEVPHPALGKDWAAYMAAGKGQKGDTLYIPSDFDIGNLGHRAAVVHELSHAADDKAVTGNRVEAIQRDAAELRAYRNQGRFQLTSIAGLSGTARTDAIRQAGSLWNAIVAYATALEARVDQRQFKPILVDINAAAPAGTGISDADLNGALTLNSATVETFVLALIRSPIAYNLPTPESNKALVDGLRGPSILDWIDRPLPGDP
jgi:hypothetical protein